MVHDHEKILDYWNREDVESMYDKYLLELETALIGGRIRANSKILDAGCGEAEGTAVYARIPGTVVHAVDFSDTRLKKAAQRLNGFKNVLLRKIDLLGTYSLDSDYDFVVSQRFLINLMQWNLQTKVLSDFRRMLRPGGKLLMLEGNQDGVESLNRLRAALGLDPIPVKWHNLFFHDASLKDYMASVGFRLLEEDGLGEYFLLSRGIRPYFESVLNWDSEFNKVSSGETIRSLLGLKQKFSRLKLWVFERPVDT